jgi:putative PEP-CTERM system TPR-repeat lipoprotein
MAGLIALARKDPAAARKSFERALELDPRYFVAAAGLAELDFRENRLEDARRRFERFLNKSPKHVLTLLALSEIGGRAKDAAAYVKWLEAARAADPAAVEPAARLSAYYQSQGNPAKALEHARAAASRNPSSAAALDVLGTAQMSNREFNAAAQTYLKVVELTPKHAVSHFRLAAAQQASGDLGGAEARYRKAVELDPQYVNAWIALGALQVNKGETKQALNTAATIRKLAPTAPHAHAIEGEALLREKRNAEAAKAFERALALDASGANAVKIYTARWRAGNQTGAMSGLEEWVESHPQDLAAQRVLADAYLATGRTTDAIRHYQKLAAASPKDGVVLNNLAVSYLALKDPKAEEIARRAYEVAGNEAYALDTYGWVLVEHGKVKEGLPLLEKAKSLSPKTDEISYHLAVALARSGDKVRARKELEALLALKKTSPYAQQARSLLGTL